MLPFPISYKMRLLTCRAALSDRRGNVAVIFALTLVPILGASGAAVDYSRATSFRAQLQNAVDETALKSFAVEPELRQTSAARRLSLLGSGYQGVTVTSGDNEVEVIATASVKTAILSAIGMDEIRVVARAKAAAAQEGPKACLLGLNREVSNAVSFSGTSSYVGKDCAVYSNSRDAKGLSINGNARPEAEGFCSAGGATTPAGFTPPPKTNCPHVSDPFAGKIQPPDSAGCTFNKVSVQPGKEVDLEPGVYCGGLSVQGTVRLAEGGTYVFKDGELNVNAGGSLSGTGVLLYLTGKRSGFTINGGGEVRLDAAKTGDYRGVVIYQDPLSNTGAENHLNGNATTVINGAIYTPGNGVRINGSSGFGQESVYMPVIADTITVTGSTRMRIDLDDSEMIAPLPEMGEVVRLVE